MVNTWIWDSAGGAFNSPGNWVSGDANGIVNGVPGPSDTGVNVAGTVTGDGTIGYLEALTATFTGSISAGSIVFVGQGAAQGDTLSATDVFSVANGASLSATGGAVLNGPSAGVGFEDSGTVGLTGGSKINTGTLNAFGDLEVTDGTVTATDFTAGTLSGGSSTLNIGAAGTVNDTLGVLGIAAGASVTAALDGGTWSNGELIVGSAGNVTFTVSNGASLTADGSYAVFPGAPALFVGSRSASDVSTMTITGSKVTVTGEAAVGAESTATVTFGTGGEMDVSGVLNAGASAGGVGSLDVSGGSALLKVGGDGSIGVAGKAQLSIGSGDTATFGGLLDVGGQQGGNGTLSVGGSLDVTGNATIGDAGTASVTVATSSTFSVGAALDVGAGSGGNGTVSLDTGGVLDIGAGSNVTVGDAGTGSLDVNGGTLGITTGNIVIANVAASTGDMSVEKTQITTSGNITVGQAGAATLSVNQGGGIAGITLAIGSGFNSNGSFALDGTGSTADVNILTDGASGTGSLQVTNKGLLTATGNATLASQGTAVQQTASIGTKGSLVVAGVLDVAKAGNAILTVDTNGLVQAPTVLVGDTAGATGTLALSGASGGVASTLQYGTLLAVGKSGTGSLSITRGAMVTASATHTGTVEIGVSSGSVGNVLVSGASAELAAALLTVGGGKSAAGGSGTLAIGAGGTVAADAATIWSTGVVTLSGGTLDPDPITNQGSISGFGTLAGAVNNTGSITASGGTLVLTGSVDGAGALGVTSGARLDLRQAVTATTTLAMVGGTLEVDTLAGMLGTIENFAAGEAIVLSGVTADGGTLSAGVLTLTDAGATVGTLALGGIAGTTTFTVTNSGGTTDVTVACFAAGTRIATPDGTRPVEQLRPGDAVRLADGSVAEVRWVGARAVRCEAHPAPRAVWPFRVRTGAFGANLPARDLWLSPDHAVFVAGVLIPIRCLATEGGIEQVPMARVSYHHLELDRHDVLLAEGLPCESFLDTGNRAAFAGAGQPTHLHADFAARVWDADACAPIAVAGPDVAAVLRRVRQRARRQARGAGRDQSLSVAS